METAPMRTFVGSSKRKKKPAITPLKKPPGFSKRNKTGGTKHSVASGGGSL